jgi:lipopolysaccharide/colanic/teichoic acid biosynthesis glycosyltransferase/glycosyltransferase involved in cell wall biosynthesis
VMGAPAENQATPRKVLLLSHVDVNIALFRRALVQRLVREGVEVTVCVPPGPRVGEIEALGATVRPYSLVRGSLNPFSLFSPVRALRRIIKDVRPDVVHSFTHQPNILARLATPSGIPVVNSVTGLGSCFLGEGVKGRMVRALFHFLYRATAGCCAALVFQNRDDEAYFQGHGMAGGMAGGMASDMASPARGVCIRGSGVDLERFSPGAYSPEERENARAELGFTPDNVVFTMAARLVRDKGIREFLEAARRVAESCPNARFVLVGEPDSGNPSSLSSEEMRRAAEDGTVVFAGWREDMPLVWAMSDVAVLPSYREGLPVSLQEALASGLPVVATDVPGCREIAGEGGHCLLVAPRESAPLAEAMCLLAESPELRLAKGKAARAKAEAEFDAHVLAGEHLGLYASLRQKNCETDKAGRDRPSCAPPVWPVLPVFRAPKPKRWLDLGLVLLTSPLWLPLLALVAVVVAVRLGRPVLFRQTRPGLGGKPFQLMKFRTMTDRRGPDGELLSDGERLTPLGRRLRSTSLDELPELINVLKGEMSLVGPRPLLMEYLPLYSPEQARRHETLPGITGWAQINGRNALSWPEVFRLDFWYVDHLSLWLDLKILFLTLGKVIRREGISAPGSATREKFEGEQ